MMRLSVSCKYFQADVDNIHLIFSPVREKLREALVQKINAFVGVLLKSQLVNWELAVIYPIELCQLSPEVWLVVQELGIWESLGLSFGLLVKDLLIEGTFRFIPLLFPLLVRIIYKSLHFNELLFISFLTCFFLLDL